MRFVGGEAVVGRGPTDGAGLLFLGQLDRDVGREEIDAVALALDLEGQDALAPDFLARGAADLFHLLRHGLTLVGTVSVELAVLQHVRPEGPRDWKRVAS